MKIKEIVRQKIVASLGLNVQNTPSDIEPIFGEFKRLNIFGNLVKKLPK